jgi:hypothetical protein
MFHECFLFDPFQDEGGTTPGKRESFSYQVKKSNCLSLDFISLPRKKRLFFSLGKRIRSGLL